MADLAVAAGGTASWELAFLKVPALIFILADNQAAVAKALDEFGTALRLGRPGNLNREELAGAISHLLEGYRAFRFGKGGLATGCSSSRKSRDDVFESPRLSLEVSGYTDNVPISTSRFPQTGSCRRRAPVALPATYSKSGIDLSRITARGYANQRPRLPNYSFDNQRVNRQVEIRLYRGIDQNPSRRVRGIFQVSVSGIASIDRQSSYRIGSGRL